MYFFVLKCVYFFMLNGRFVVIVARKCDVVGVWEETHRGWVYGVKWNKAETTEVLKIRIWVPLPTMLDMHQFCSNFFPHILYINELKTFTSICTPIILCISHAPFLVHFNLNNKTKINEFSAWVVWMIFSAKMNEVF